MGLIQTIFKTIFGLIGSIFSAIFGIFGLGKKSEFFLEIEEADSGAKSAPGTDSPATAAVDPPQSKPATASAAPQAVEKSQPAPAAPQPAASIPATAAPKAAPSPGTFATDYLVNPNLPTRSRRRPGPSLSPFKDLARQVKAPAQ